VGTKEHRLSFLLSFPCLSFSYAFCPSSHHLGCPPYFLLLLPACLSCFPFIYQLSVSFQPRSREFAISPGPMWYAIIIIIIIPACVVFLVFHCLLFLPVCLSCCWSGLPFPSVQTGSQAQGCWLEFLDLAIQLLGSRHIQEGKQVIGAGVYHPARATLAWLNLMVLV